MYRWWIKIYYRFLETKKEKYLQKLINSGLVMGRNVVIAESIFLDPSHCYLISIGDDCTFAPGVRLIAHDASIYLHLGYTKIGRIKIGNKCFLGDGVAVLPNVTIGEGSIIGTGSIVIKDVPPGMIAAGNPAKVICSVDDYLNKVKKMAEGKKIFGQDYFLENLTDEKRQEMLQAVDDGVGFMV